MAAFALDGVLHHAILWGFKVLGYGCRGSGSSLKQI